MSTQAPAIHHSQREPVLRGGCIAQANLLHGRPLTPDRHRRGHICIRFNVGGSSRKAATPFYTKTWPVPLLSLFNRTHATNRLAPQTFAIANAPSPVCKLTRSWVLNFNKGRFGSTEMNSCGSSTWRAWRSATK